MMKGIEFIRDHSGQLKEIRLAVMDHPALAADISRLISIHARSEQQATPTSAKAQMPLKDFRKLVREAKQSGEVSESAFFQKNPEWQRKQG